MAHAETLIIGANRVRLTGHTVFFSPDDPRFCQAMESNARRKYQVLLHETPQDVPISVRPCFKRMPRKLMTSFRHTYITGWFGQYELHSDRAEMLDLLYQVGIGAKSSQGFGMFNVVG